jgi:hypothetical protein
MRLFIIVAAAGMFLGSIGYSASDVPAANTGNLDFKQWGLLAIQDGGRDRNAMYDCRPPAGYEHV